MTDRQADRAIAAKATISMQVSDLTISNVRAVGLPDGATAHIEQRGDSLRVTIFGTPGVQSGRPRWGQPGRNRRRNERRRTKERSDWRVIATSTPFSSVLPAP